MNATKFPENHVAAVNAIGLCSSIGHVILKQHRKKKTSKKDNFMPHLVLVSARHEPGLFNIIKKVTLCVILFNLFKFLIIIFRNILNYS